MRHLAVTLTRCLWAVVLLFSLACQQPRVNQKSETKTGESSDFVVTLLGTGNPIPSPRRSGVSTLVEVGGKKLIFDAGRGSASRLAQVRKRGLAQIDHIFLTHLHSDHIMGLSDLWHTGWLRGRKFPLAVSGPEGTRELTTHLRAAYERDFQFRLATPPPGRTPEGFEFAAQDITAGPVYSEDGVVVTAFDVDHGWIHPALGFRVDYHGRSVVFSGDTRFSENLIQHAQGVDLLIHEVSTMNYGDPGIGRAFGIPNLDSLAIEKLRARISAAHTTPQDAGTVFARTRPKLAVYSHLILAGFDPSNNDGETAVLTETRETYSGPVVVGEDLMQISIGAEVRVLN